MLSQNLEPMENDYWGEIRKNRDLNHRVLIVQRYTKEELIEDGWDEEALVGIEGGAEVSLVDLTMPTALCSLGRPHYWAYSVATFMWDKDKNLKPTLLPYGNTSMYISIPQGCEFMEVPPVYRVGSDALPNDWEDATDLIEHHLSVLYKKDENFKTTLEYWVLNGWGDGHIGEKYFRVADTQTGGYLHTGYNATSRKELNECLKSYFSIDWDHQEDGNPDTIDFIKHAESVGFYVEESELPFRVMN